MDAYKFEATVQENGILQIPEIAKFAHQQVEIFIVVTPKTKLEAEKQEPVETFLNKWKGSLKGLEPDRLKSEYLQEKYG